MYNYLKIIGLITLCLAIGVGCKVKPKDHVGQQVNEYATLFSIKKEANYTVVQLFSPQNKQEVAQTFVCYPKGTNAASLDTLRGIKVQIPLANCAVLSSSFFGFFSELNAIETIVGVETDAFVFQPQILKNIERGTTQMLRTSGELNYEQLIQLKPQAIFESGSMVESSTTDKSKSLGLLTIPCYDWRETHPLGKAEWMRFFGVFLDKLDLADSLFQIEKNNYNQLAQVQSKQKNKPSVLVNSMYQNAWYFPGGNSFMAHLLADAGFNYVLKADSSAGALPKSFEWVVAELMQADVWLNPSLAIQFTDLANQNNSYKQFAAFKSKRIFNQTKQMNELGGNNFWELGAVKPHLVLQDLIEIANNPTPDTSKLYFYEQLK